MTKQAEQIKSQLLSRLKSLEIKKTNDEKQLKADEALVMRSRNDPNMDTAMYMRETYEDKKKIMDDNHEISELKKKIADVDTKIGEINHWTAQTEYEDPKKRQQALEMARRTLQAI